jgi:hypothetical protein
MSTNAYPMMFKIFKNLKLKLFLVLFTIIFISPISNLLAIELQFPNGDVFHAELILDDERLLTVRYRGNDYKIPKKDLDSFDIGKKTSPNTSYKISTFFLKNGSIIKGLIAEEKKEEFVVKSELGFLTLNKSEIKPPFPGKELHPEFPEEYRANDKANNQTRLGVSFQYLPLFQPLANATPPLNGLSFFVEPAFLKFGNSIQTGFRFEYLESSGPVKEIRTQSGYAYLTYSKMFNQNPILDFYGTFGGGSSLLTFHSSQNQTNYSGTSPSAYVELGWQGLKVSNSFYRIGWKNLCFFEEQKTLCGSGLEISGGWSF